MNKTISHLHIFFIKNKLTDRCFKSSPSIYTSWIGRLDFLHFFGQVRFASAQLASSPLFALPSAASPLTNVIILLRRITLPSHWVKMSLLLPLHLLTMLYSVVSPLKLKLKHWIHTTTAGYPPWTTQLVPSTAIKRSSQSWPLSPSLNRISILPSP
jgi:hypothetical protein